MDFIETFTNPTFLVTILTAICAFATVLTIALPMLAQDRMNHRMRTMAVERDKMRAERMSEMSRDRQGRLRQTPAGFMQQIVNALNYRNLDDVPEFKGKNTTTEFLSKHIYHGLANAARAGELGRPGVELRALRITLSESHIARASYEAPLW